MVTITNVKIINNGKSIIDGVCLSTDTKPTIYGNGSTLAEMDTSKLYFYDADNSEWKEWA